MRLRKGFIYTFLFSIAWAFSIIVTKIILKNGENAYNVAFWTTILAFPYWFYTFLGQTAELKKITKKDYLILLGMGLISTVGLSITEVFALKYSQAINYSFLIKTTVIFTIFFAYIFLGEKITKKKIILAFLILTGVYLLTTKGKPISLSLGDIFTLFEAVLISFGNNILGKIAINRMTRNLSASGSYLIGFLPIILIAYFNGAIALPKIPLLIFILTAISIFMINSRFLAYKHATASYVTLVVSFTPVFVCLMAIPILKEGLTAIQILGGLLIVSAGILVEKLKI